MKSRVLEFWTLGHQHHHHHHHHHWHWHPPAGGIGARARNGWRRGERGGEGGGEPGIPGPRGKWRGMVWRGCARGERDDNCYQLRNAHTRFAWVSAHTVTVTVPKRCDRERERERERELRLRSGPDGEVSGLAKMTRARVVGLGPLKSPVTDPPAWSSVVQGMRAWQARVRRCRPRIGAKCRGRVRTHVRGQVVFTVGRRS